MERSQLGNNPAGAQSRLSVGLGGKLEGKMGIVEVFHIDDGQAECCPICMEVGDFTEHKKGGAYLAGSNHPPYDGEAHFICSNHLAREAIVVVTPNVKLAGSALLRSPG